MRAVSKSVSGQYFRLRIWGVNGTAYHKKDRLQLEIIHTADTSTYYTLSGTGTPSMSCEIWATNGDARIDLTDYARAQEVGITSTITITDYQGRSLSFSLVAYEGAYYPLISQVAGYPRATIPPRTMIEQGGFASANVVVSDFLTSLQSETPPMYEVGGNVRTFTTTIGGVVRLTKMLPQVCGKNYIQLQWQALAQPDSDVVVYKRAVWVVEKITGQAEAVALSAQVGHVPNSVRGVGCKVVAVLDNLDQDDVAYYADIIYSDVVRGALAVDDNITGETMQVYIETNSVDITGGKISLTINMGEYGI